MAGVDQGAPEITVARNIRAGDLVIHRASLLPGDVTKLGPMPVTDPARTLLDLGAVVPEVLVEQALDDALVRGVVTVPRLRRRLAARGGSGRRGVGVLRMLLVDRDPAHVPPQSVLETRVARMLRWSGLPPPVRQFEVRVNGQLVARPDFAWPDARVALEADGYVHHAGTRAWSRDLERRNALTALGWVLVHVRWADLRSPEGVIRVLWKALSAAAPGTLASGRR
jgi:hypothetical protein